jgi:hypothetical protein
MVLNIIKEDSRKLNNQKKLIIHCCHHKTGTVVIEKVLRNVCNHFGLKYQYCPQSKLENDTDVWLEHHSHIDFSKINRPIIGTHMIRNPCAIIISAYEYHKTTKEDWANRKINKMNNLTYKQILSNLDEKNGIIFETKNDLYVESSKNTIMDIYNWDYEMPNFLEFKYEDLMSNYNGTLSNMFKHYGFTKDMIKESLKIAEVYNIRKKDEKDLQKNGHITNKSIDLDKWKNYFTDKDLTKVFKSNFPSDIFDKIGYPIDNLNLLEQK